VSWGVDWVVAAGEGSDPSEAGVVPEESRGKGSAERFAGGRAVGKFPEKQWLGELPVHNFPGNRDRGPEGAAGETALDRNPDIWLYRKRTTSLLRRYMRYSVETGRLPSIVGREMFRARVTQYTVTTFEDRVIFVRDVERCLGRLSKFDQQIIARCVLQEYSRERASALLGCTRRTIERRLPEILDELSESFLAARLLEVLPQQPRENSILPEKNREGEDQQ